MIVGAGLKPAPTASPTPSPNPHKWMVAQASLTKNLCGTGWKPVPLKVGATRRVALIILRFQLVLSG